MVIDSSIACAWVFEDEVSPSTESLLDLLKTGSGLVPTIWPIEMANVLAGAERSGRIAPGEALSALADLGKLPIELDSSETIDGVRDIVRLALDQRLTAYDASYLALALRTGLPLATKDTALAAAAGRTGVAVLP